MKETSDRMLTVLLSLLSTSCCPSRRSSTIYGIKETQSTKQPRIQNELGEKQRWNKDYKLLYLKSVEGLERHKKGVRGEGKEGEEKLEY